MRDLFDRLRHHGDHLEDLVDTLVEVRVAVEDEHTPRQILFLLVGILQRQVFEKE